MANGENEIKNDPTTEGTGLQIPKYAWSIMAVATLMIIGGVIYTLGAVVYITKIFNFVPGVFGFHEVWHIFVLVAAIAHFVAVLGVAI